MMITMMMMMMMMMMVLTSSDLFHGPPFEGSKDGGSREHQPNGITFDHGNVHNINKHVFFVFLVVLCQSPGDIQIISDTVSI